MCGELALFGGDLALLKKPACVPPPCTASLVLRDKSWILRRGPAHYHLDKSLWARLESPTAKLRILKENNQGGFEKSPSFSLRENPQGFLWRSTNLIALLESTFRNCGQKYKMDSKENNGLPRLAVARLTMTTKKFFQKWILGKCQKSTNLESAFEKTL
ncbi:hypothetical protein [Helicobacter canis]|uniref:Uncharacterized protein n=1 Tax=Helicobacter canis TaxID=29419 RepID=A0A377J6E6_9HELI|nr:hypothetical protein [Helicobacter canis]STO97889.1 Uncharacterised protein [Helicobacter canis]